MSQVQSVKEASEERIGRVISEKFKLRRCVGIGSSGIVYQADQIALGRTVAVKVLNDELAADPRLVKRFHDEALAASRLNHPNTVSIIDYGQTPDGLLYLVMEYLRGPTLTRLLRESFPLDQRRVLDITRQILLGLEEAHLAGVVHADLKADNIVVEPRRSGIDLVKVVDFGIARLVNAPRSAEDEKVICGTPEYMAPEIIGGVEPSFASDIYALGIVLYEMLVGVTPFVGGSAMEVLSRHLREAPPPLREIRPELELPPALDSLITSALAKHPRDRPQTAEAMLALLDQVSSPAARVAAPAAQVTCEACGARALDFKFCPECGSPRTAVRRTIEVEALGALETRATAKTAYAAAVDSSAQALLFPLPFAGRNQELATMVRFIRGQLPERVMQVFGPTGIGRSRLLNESYLEALGTQEIIVFQSSPDPSGLALPLYPVRAVAAAVLDLPPVCPFESLSAAVLELGLLERDVPGIAELFGHNSELSELEPPVRRRELIASTVRVLRAAAKDQAVVLVFEDAHLYDQSSQELIRRLCDQADEHDLRIVLTNDEELAERWPSTVGVLSLEPLAESAVTSLVEHVAGNLSGTLLDSESVHAVTGGVPAHLAQLMHYVVEGGTAEAPFSGLADLITARLAALPRSSLLLLQTAAVVGADMTRDLLRHAFAGVASDGFNDILAQLVVRDLLADDGVIVSFRNRVVRDVVYDATPADVRRNMHASVVDLLAQAAAPAAVLGHHYELAGNLGPAALHLEAGGDEAVHQLDDLAATSLFQRALLATRHRMLSGADDDEGRLRFVGLSVKLADSLRLGGEVGLARGIVDEAKGYCDGAPALEAQLLRASAHLQSTDDDIDGGLEILRRAIGLVIPTGKRDLLVELYLDLATMHLRRGDSNLAIGELEECLDMITLGEGAAATDGPTMMWKLLLRLGQLHGGLGDLARSVFMGEHALRHARRIHSMLGAARSQTMLAADYERAGNLTRAAACRKAAVDELRRLGDRRGTAELLLAGTSPTRTLLRIAPQSLDEARELALEMGWREGVIRSRP